MPPAKKKLEGMLDTWGRRNRSLPDHECPRCGTKFKPYRKSSKYCSRKCSWANNGGHNKKDEGWWMNSKGYIEGYIWEGNKKRRVKKHRLVMESHIGRNLLLDEDVHHVNGDRQDNRIENLQLMSHAEHTRLENLIRSQASPRPGGGQRQPDAVTPRLPHSIRRMKCQKI